MRIQLFALLTCLGTLLLIDVGCSDDSSPAGNAGSTGGTSPDDLPAGQAGAAGSAAGTTASGSAGTDLVIHAGHAGSTSGGASGSGAGGNPSCTPRDSSGAGGAVSLPAATPPAGQACDVEGLEICTDSMFSPRTLSRCESGAWVTTENPSTCTGSFYECNWGASSQNVDAIHDGVCCDTIAYCAQQKAFCDGTRWHALPSTP